ncbi:unnamed protein product [Schistosoma turkestanicum]|nr:unnamed protein product [Schistosoma turkestanicum]
MKITLKMGHYTIVKISYVLINLFLILLLLWSGIHWYTDSESNRCIITQLMEIPEYKEINVDHDQPSRFLGYALYQYQEGSRYRSGPNNTPVLFVTGSQGSFKTIRSLATTIYNFVQHNSPIDYYSVDLNEEQSALSGEIIERQTGNYQSL